jgi:hypothetical protein
MKREIATLNIEIHSDTRAATDQLLVAVKAALEARPPRVVLPDFGAAEVQVVNIGRVRPKVKRTRDLSGVKRG